MPFESLSKPENAAAVWSAVAASFSALAAYLSWRAQIRTLHHSFRPEIVIAGWNRPAPTPDTPDELCFSTVMNAGRDTARQIVVNAIGETDNNQPTYVGTTVNVGSLTAGEQVTIDGRIVLFWPNVKKLGPLGKLLQVKVIVWCWDALGVRHQTTISLLVTERADGHVGNTVNLAPGVFLRAQITESIPVWQLKLSRAVGRIPLLGRLVRSDA